MERVRLSLKEKMNLVVPYAYHNIMEQLEIVVPVCLYIVLFQLIILHYGIMQIGVVTGGIVLVFLGLAFFLEGIKIGPVPIGEIVGNSLPKKQSSTVVLVFAFFLGILAAFGEPVMGTLQLAGAHINPEEAPLLYMLLVGKPDILVLTVAFGVGIAVLIGTLRFLHGWSLKVIILPLVVIAIVLTVFASFNTTMATAIGLAWDTGAVIVGPVLCPLVLALGVGVCRASGKTNPSIAGFGMVGLISVVPITMVVILTIVLAGFGGKEFTDPETVAASAHKTVQLDNVPKVELPADLDFSTYYPKLRHLTLPESLAFENTMLKLESLTVEQRAVFDQAYRIVEERHEVKLQPRIPPAARSAIFDVLLLLGLDPDTTDMAKFKKVYQIEVTNEANLSGTIRVKSDATDLQRYEARQILNSMGYVDMLPVLIDSFVLGARAIIPIFAFLFVVMLLLKQKGPPVAQLGYALLFAIIGLGLFFFGLSIGLGQLGNQMGDRMPIAFLDYLPLFPNEVSLFSPDIGKVVIILFAVALGYGATLAEPAFNVLGQQVEDVTQGAFKKNLFSQAVALGVGIGAGLGIMSLLYNINLMFLLLPPYVLLAILTVLNKEIFVNIAWDGGAVTTGPVTVPLKLALGLSLSAATGAGEGFGVLALASAYPVLNILLLGLYLSRNKTKEHG